MSSSHARLDSRVQALTDWYERFARPLPWRRTSDPYSIWISEVMLQQTQVVTVIPYYERFLKYFPDVNALAQSREEDVLKLWAGLGYYSRAKNLRRGAIYVVEKHAGRFPANVSALLEIPGIGPYTAGAIASIGFDLPAPIVDGNVQRVFARFFALQSELESSEARAFFWEEALRWVRRAKSPRHFNQALMELGATLCSKSQPRCGQCPLSEGCLGYRQGIPAQYPKRRKHRASKDLWWAALIAEDKGKVRLVQNPEGGWWSGLWDFPRLEGEGWDSLRERVLAELEGRGYRWKRTLSEQRHTVTHHKIRVQPFVVQAAGESEQLPLGCSQAPAVRWVSLEQASDLPLSSLARKILGAYAAD